MQSWSPEVGALADHEAPAISFEHQGAAVEIGAIHAPLQTETNEPTGWAQCRRAGIVGVEDRRPAGLKAGAQLELTLSVATYYLPSAVVPK